MCKLVLLRKLELRAVYWACIHWWSLSPKSSKQQEIKLLVTPTACCAEIRNCRSVGNLLLVSQPHAKYGCKTAWSAFTSLPFISICLQLLALRLHHQAIFGLGCIPAMPSREKREQWFVSTYICSPFYIFQSATAASWECRIIDGNIWQVFFFPEGNLKVSVK